MVDRLWAWFIETVEIARSPRRFFAEPEQLRGPLSAYSQAWVCKAFQKGEESNMSSTSPNQHRHRCFERNADIAVHETETHWTTKHEFSEFPPLLKSLQALKPTRIIVEASSGLENLLVSYLAAASLPVIVVNPRQVCDFARATGQLAKTDRIDAFVLARFRATMAPEIYSCCIFGFCRALLVEFV